MRLSDLGLSVDLPSGWDGRIYGRESNVGALATLHAATFPLPNRRGDFGGGAVELMGADDVLVVLLEYDPSRTGQALFHAEGPPPALDPARFSTTVLQRSLPGQAGSQTFFSARGRALCLYAVVGSATDVGRLAGVANRVVGTITVDDR